MLLMGRIEFFDRHSTTRLTQLISVELDSLRSLVFGNVSRDRGARAVLEAVGSVLVCARSCQIRHCSLQVPHACMCPGGALCRPSNGLTFVVCLGACRCCLC